LKVSEIRWGVAITVTNDSRGVRSSRLFCFIRNVFGKNLNSLRTSPPKSRRRLMGTFIIALQIPRKNLLFQQASGRDGPCGLRALPSQPLRYFACQHSADFGTNRAGRVSRSSGTDSRSKIVGRPSMQKLAHARLLVAIKHLRHAHPMGKDLPYDSEVIALMPVDVIS
jgi:hypothetical protein